MLEKSLTRLWLFTSLPPCLLGCLCHGLLLQFPHHFDLSCLSSYFWNMMGYKLWNQTPKRIEMISKILTCRQSLEQPLQLHFVVPTPKHPPLILFENCFGSKLYCSWAGNILKWSHIYVQVAKCPPHFKDVHWPWASSLRSNLALLTSWKLFSPTLRGWVFHCWPPAPSPDGWCSDFKRRLRRPSIAMILGVISSSASKNHCGPWEILQRRKKD